MYDVTVDRTFTVADLAAKIEFGEPFAFSRWGDGEWRAVVSPNANKSNCDGHAFFPGMSEALRDVLRERPPYILGFQEWPKKKRKPWCDWLEKEGLTDLQWCESNIFHFAAQKGDWQFRDWPDVLVGPSHLHRVFPHTHFVEIPSKNCWLATDDVLGELYRILTDAKQHAVVGYCASMAANVWISLMHHEFSQHTHIDMGSVFDPLAGVHSRRYMRAAAKKGNAGG